MGGGQDRSPSGGSIDLTPYNLLEAAGAGITPLYIWSSDLEAGGRDSLIAVALRLSMALILPFCVRR